MSMKAASLSDSGFTTAAPPKSNVRWFVCFLLFLATTINYMDRSVFSLIEPLLHLPFMGWIPGLDAAHQIAYDLNYGRILICFQIAYGVGFLFAGRIIDKLGTKTGYALAIGIWACASISHSLVASVAGFCIARVFLGLGESGNFPAAIKATTEWFPAEERALATGLFNSGTNASFFIAPILIAAVTAKWGWHAAFICTGSMGLLWLVIWIVFPYNKLRRGATQTQADLAPVTQGGPLYSILVKHRGFWAFCIAKGITDPIWWFYLFYLPKFLNDNYGLNLNEVKYPLIVIYTFATVGSIAGGWLSGFRMTHGHSVNSGRKFALLICAVCVLPIMLVPHMHVISPHNAWPAIGLFCLATAAHQGWSANIFSTPTDMFPSTSVSTVVGIGGAAGALGGAVFTWLVSHFFSLHPMLIFTLAAFAYVIALVIFQLLVPRLGETRTA
ncbi:MFS transporter [Edaphobacter paludis]|uniref:MFS transporter n=1 Tax=Edaphobacter paludis TaxID=3035702 RepID=A0AAU7CUP3_9BACT